MLDVREEQDCLLNVGGQMQQIRDLRHPSPCDVPQPAANSHMMIQKSMTCRQESAENGIAGIAIEI